MKTCIALLAFSFAQLAVTSARGAEISADDAYAAFTNAEAAQFQWMSMPRNTPEQQAAREAERRRMTDLLVNAAGKFVANHPGDSRRWQAMQKLVFADRRFEGPTADADRLAWRVLTTDYERQILETPGVPAEVVEEFAMFKVVHARVGVYKEAEKTGKFDPALWREALDAFARRTPASSTVVMLEHQYAEFLLEKFPEQGEKALTKWRQAIDDGRRRDPNSPELQQYESRYAEVLARDFPALAEKHLDQLAASPDAAIAKMARGMMNAMAASRESLDLKFTAVDGREIDVAKMRGKVVIVDFWATWCGPCLQELPNTKAAYEAYRPHGVEMIGVSFDQAPREGQRSPSDRTREQFVEATKKLGMTWPQYYDGKGRGNELGQRFGVNSIPRVWILNKQGVLVTQYATGKKIWDLLAELTGHTAEIPAEFAANKGD